jgi:hypothetical protein
MFKDPPKPEPTPPPQPEKPWEPEFPGSQWPLEDPDGEQ